MPAPYKKLNEIIGSLLGSKNIKLNGMQSLQRAAGLPVDTKRTELFMQLANHLETVYFPEIKDPQIENREYFENKAFFDSYFSNYIEGTDFLIEEAEQIIFDNKKIENRIDDSHDIYGTFKIVSDKSFMTQSPQTFHNFIDSLVSINKSIIPTRLNKYPGEFKKKANKAGNTVFVHPDYVEGTLKKAFEIAKMISNPLAKGVFLSFVVSEVHPFTDGNGRTCRIVLNKELLSAGQNSLIIPTVFREDYILSLRALSRKGRPEPIIAMFIRAFRFSHLDFKDYQSVKTEIIMKNWFLEPDEGKIVE